jgi:uncharacterized membrane protein
MINRLTVRTIVIIAIAVALGILLVRVLSGCAHNSQGSTETQLYTALDIIADSVDPASQLAKSACVARERAEVDAVKKGESNTGRAEEALKIVRARCDVLKSTFDRIRIAHADAVRLVREGAVEKAQEKLAELRQLWQSLNMLSEGSGT